MIKAAHYPQLALLIWNRGPDPEVTEAEALSFYEGYWRFVDVPALTDPEKALIDHLVKTIGNGVLNV